MYVKQCLTYKMYLNEEETLLMRAICTDALVSGNDVHQFTASQIIKKVFAGGSCKLTIPEGMVKRFNSMIQDTDPGLFSLLGIKERQQ